MEHALLLLFLGLGAYAYIEASSEIGFWIFTIDTGDGFRPAAAIFPRLTAGATIILALLLIFRNHLPDPLHHMVSEPVDLLSSPDFDDEEHVKDTSGFEDVHMRDVQITGLLVIGYFALSLLLGLLIASPLFVLVYTVWRGLPWYGIIGLTVSSFIIAYVFMVLLFLPLDEGILLDWLGV